MKRSSKKLDEFSIAMPRSLSGVPFDIALNAFHHATFGCLFGHQVHILISMGRFMDVIWYDLNRTPEIRRGIPKKDIHEAPL